MAQESLPQIEDWKALKVQTRYIFPIRLERLSQENKALYDIVTSRVVKNDRGEVKYH